VRAPSAVPLAVGELEGDLGALATDVFFLDLRAGDAGNRYLMSRTADLAPLLALEPAQVRVDVEHAAGTSRLELRHAGGPAAPALVLEDARPPGTPGWAVFEDNVIDLLPGEARTVQVTWREAGSESRAVLLGGWNVERLRVG
jgi:beta-mannosidase